MPKKSTSRKTETETDQRRLADELQRALDGVKQQAASYRSVFEAGSEGYVVHENGIIIEVNPQFVELTGYKSSELVGESFLKLVADESRDLVVERMRTRPGKPFEIVGLKSNDTRINLEVIGKDHLHQGREVRLVCIRDITERKQAEAELRDSEAPIEITMSKPQTRICPSTLRAGWSLNAMRPRWRCSDAQETTSSDTRCSNSIHRSRSTECSMHCGSSRTSVSCMESNFRFRAKMAQ